jgi:hypothetical protein
MPTLTRVVHAAVLLDFDGHQVLTDPWFSQKPGSYHGEPLAFTRPAWPGWPPWSPATATTTKERRPVRLTGYPWVGTSRMPSCWKNSRLSALAQYSASLPSAMRRVSVPVKVTSRPTASGDAPGKPPR